jgi:hypothetical protein
MRSRQVEHPMTEPDDASHSSAFVDMLYLIAATVCFVAAHFRFVVGDPEPVFWLGIIFNVFLMASINKRW